MRDRAAAQRCSVRLHRRWRQEIPNTRAQFDSECLLPPHRQLLFPSTSPPARPKRSTPAQVVATGGLEQTFLVILGKCRGTKVEHVASVQACEALRGMLCPAASSVLSQVFKTGRTQAMRIPSTSIEPT